RLKTTLRSPGLDGTPYRFSHGDREQSARLDREVHAKPMPFSHSIIPRVAPFTHRTVSQYGKISFTWAGSVPEVTIADVGLFFFKGVFTYESEKWAKHRRILNPAFHMEKLKQMLPAFRTCCDDLISKWENTVVGSGTCYELDVWSDLQTFAVNVISTAALETSFEEGRRVYQIQTQQIVPFVQAAQSLNIPGSV
ncbi:unnamed protein product, partial [Musa hybrid cultivar]